jgi:hypothetical protein
MYQRRLTGSLDVLRTLVTHHQLLPPLRKLRILSLGASSLQSKRMGMDCLHLYFPQMWGPKLTLRLQRTLHSMLGQGSTSFSKRRNPRKSRTSVQKMSSLVRKTKAGSGLRLRSLLVSPRLSLQRHLRQHLCSRPWGRSLCRFTNLRSRMMTILPFPSPLRPLSPVHVPLHPLPLPFPVRLR